MDFCVVSIFSVVFIQFHSVNMPCLYTDEEILEFLSKIEELNVQKRIDGKTQRNIEIFRQLAEAMETDKTAEQWRVKWKALKAKYLEEKRKCSPSGVFCKLQILSVSN